MEVGGVNTYLAHWRFLEPGREIASDFRNHISILIMRS